jgi:hypothetical protein
MVRAAAISQASRPAGAAVRSILLQIYRTSRALHPVADLPHQPDAPSTPVELGGDDEPIRAHHHDHAED